MDKQTEIDLMWEWWQRYDLRQLFPTISAWLKAAGLDLPVRS